MRVVPLSVSLGYRSRLVSSVEQWSFDLETLAMRFVALPVSLEYLSRLVSSVEQWLVDLVTLSNACRGTSGLSWVPFSTC